MLARRSANSKNSVSSLLLFSLARTRCGYQNSSWRIILRKESSCILSPCESRMEATLGPSDGLFRKDGMESSAGRLLLLLSSSDFFMGRQALTWYKSQFLRGNSKFYTQTTSKNS